MLVITRKKDERLIIGNGIKSQVLRIGRDNVRLGIKAPEQISIYRSEIYEAIRNRDGSPVESPASEEDMLDKMTQDLRLEKRS